MCERRLPGLKTENFKLAGERWEDAGSGRAESWVIAERRTGTVRATMLAPVRGAGRSCTVSLLQSFWVISVGGEAERSLFHRNKATWLCRGTW